MFNFDDSYSNDYTKIKGYPQKINLCKKKKIISQGVKINKNNTENISLFNNRVSDYILII